MFDLSDSDLTERAKQRVKIRIKYPGASALYFQWILDIVMRKVIGLDFDNGRPCVEGSLFGIPKAVVASIEEQGRTTLHTHI